MRLESKGEVKPPPTLKGPAQGVSREIQSWPGIIAATHWDFYDRTQVDGADFYVGEKELGHIHLDGELHLCVTVGLRQRLIDAGLAEALPWADDCIQAPIDDPADARNAVWLFKLAYDRLTGTPIPDLRRRISDVVSARSKSRQLARSKSGGISDPPALLRANALRRATSRRYGR